MTPATLPSPDFNIHRDIPKIFRTFDHATTAPWV